MSLESRSSLDHVSGKLSEAAKVINEDSGDQAARLESTISFDHAFGKLLQAPEFFSDDPE